MYVNAQIIRPMEREGLTKIQEKKVIFPRRKKASWKGAIRSLVPHMNIYTGCLFWNAFFLFERPRHQHTHTHTMYSSCSSGLSCGQVRYKSRSLHVSSPRIIVSYKYTSARDDTAGQITPHLPDFHSTPVIHTYIHTYVYIYRPAICIGVTILS